MSLPGATCLGLMQGNVYGDRERNLLATVLLVWVTDEYSSIHNLMTLTEKTDCVLITNWFVLGTPQLSLDPPKSKWHNDQRQIIETGRCNCSLLNDAA